MVRLRWNRLDLLLPGAPRIEDYFLQLMLMQMSLDSGRPVGEVWRRPRRYFGLVRSRADPSLAQAALQNEGWTDQSWKSAVALRSRAG